MPNQNKKDKEPSQAQVVKPTQRTKKKEKARVDIASIQNIDNAEQVKANEIAAEANRLAKNSFWVNTGLFVITLLVFGLSIYQSNIASKSVDLADSVFRATKKFNDSTIAIQRQSLDSQLLAKKQSDNADAAKLGRDTLFIKKQSEGIDAQIKAFKTQQKQFEIENRPFLQITNISVGVLTSRTPIIIKFDFINFGKQSIRGLANKYQVFAGSADVVPNLTDDDMKLSTRQNSYLIRDIHSDNTFTSDIIPTKQDSINIKNGKIGLFVKGMYRYKNTITNDENIYRYFFKIHYPKGIFNVDVLKDTTITIIKKVNKK